MTWENIKRDYDANPTITAFCQLPKAEWMRRYAQVSARMNPENWTAEDEQRDTERRGHIWLSAE